MPYADGLIRSREPLSAEEDEFVDWVLNKEDGRELHKKYTGKGQSKCKAGPCTIQ